MLEVRPLIDPGDPQLLRFLARCAEEGIVNNSSLKAIKFSQMQGESGCLLGVFKDEAMISMAGAHPLTGDFQGAFRVLFRGATLPEWRNHFPFLNKDHMNSLPFSVLLPHLILWSLKRKAQKLVITTNVDFKTTKTSNTHRLMQNLEKRGLVTFWQECELFNTQQGFWELNLLEYRKRSLEFAQRQSLALPGEWIHNDRFFELVAFSNLR